MTVLRTTIVRAALLAASAVAFVPAEAKVTGLTVEKTTSLANGYERVEGHYTGTLDPADPHNAIITDLKLAPRNAAGLVEYSATFQITRPAAGQPSTGLLVYDVANRGRILARAASKGNISVVSGWQGDLTEGPGVQYLHAPVLDLQGPAFVRFIDMPPGTATMDIKGGPQGDNDGRSIDVGSTAGAHLYTLMSDAHPGAMVELKSSAFAFADCDKVPFPGTPDLNKLCVKGGFDPKLAYTLSFTAGHPKVLGVGFAAPRDLVSFLRHDTSTANPLAGRVRWTIARGESQSGDYLHAFVNLGFNGDENGRIVFDGVMPIIAMRQIAMNYRFASPGGLVDLYELGLDGVDWWGSYYDRARGLGRHSLLDRCTAEGDCPKVVEVMGAAELRYHRGSVDFVGTDAKADIPLPPNVRRYFNASVTHGGGPGGFALTAPEARGGACALPSNPNPTAFANAALFVALAEWVTEGRAPPPSIYPSLKSGTLVSQQSYANAFPAIPGVPRPVDIPLNQYDFSRDPQFSARDVSGVLNEVPPRVVRTLPLLVPRADSDGNEVAGIRSPLLAAPLGTYLGWNLYTRGYRTGRYCYSTGGFVPFARTRAERIAKGDPRPSLEERYPSHSAFIAKVKAQADALVAQRYMLPEDAAATVAQAEAASVP